MISFPQAIKLGFKNYFKFSGRSSRAEYWWWTLFIVVPPIFLRVLDSIVLNFDIGPAGWAIEHRSIPIVTQILLFPASSLFFYSTVIPTIAMTSRRLHDVGISGWWQAAWFLIKVFSVGILGALLNPYSGSGFSAVWVITEPVLPGTILSLVITSIGLLSYNDVGISGWWQLDYISAFSPIWIAIGVPRALCTT